VRPAAVGVDLGGSWLRACAVDPRGRPLRWAKLPAPPLPRLAASLKSLWRAWGLKTAPSLTVGSKGVWKKAPRRAMAASLRGLADRLTVMSDVELTHRTLMRDGEGFLILAGTGSIALGKTASGRWVRAGGLGPRTSDEGSGYWIGRELLRRTGKRIPPLTPEGVRKTAALAALVLNRARRDPVCGKIVRDAQDRLSGLLQRLFKKGSPGKMVKVGWWGGVLEDAAFRRGFFRRLKTAAPGLRIHAAAPRMPTARAAALLGLWRGGGDSAILVRRDRRK
jgi:N-acetylglucosamine kinase-like BadF-type ATPase